MNENIEGDVLRRWRKWRGLSQSDLAEKLNVSTMSIRRYEKGERTIPDDILVRAMDVLGITPESSLAYYQEKRDAIRAEAEAHYRKISSKAEVEFKEKVDYFVSSPIGRTIIDTFFELNEYGQEEASERMIELTFLPQFSVEEVPEQWREYVSGYLSERYANKYPVEDDEELTTEPTETPTEGNTPTTQEKPPEGQTAPTDGK